MRSRNCIVFSYMMEDPEYRKAITAECKASKLTLVVVEMERPAHQQIDEWMEEMYAKDKLPESIDNLPG